MKSIFEKTGGTYSQHDFYMLPDIKSVDTEENTIGIWGQRRCRFLKTQHPIIYCNLLSSGSLFSHLSDIEQQAQHLFLQLVSEYSAQEGVTEALKSADMMLWVRKTNNIRNRAAEVVNAELIYI